MTPLQYNELDLAIQDFRSALKGCTLETPDPPDACGRSYVLISKLLEWWESAATFQGHSMTQASRLLHYAYRDVPYHSRYMNREKLFDSPPCIIVFTILLKISCGDLVHLFRILQKFDKDLPIGIESLKSAFNRMVTKRERPRDISNPDDLAAAFHKEQWKFCPVKFSLRDCPDFGPNHIIPIHKKEIISKKGGTAELWQIEVFKEFVAENLQGAVKSSEYTPEEDPDHLGARYHFALKTFKEGNQEVCDNEIDAFNALRDHVGMVRYLGGYYHEETLHYGGGSAAGHNQESTTKATQNILLEYGDRDLDDLFYFQLPPVLQTEIEEFWNHLFEVADAVEKIHNLTIVNDKIATHYYGWHADIKPENILEIGGRFKLADPGFAKFVEKDKGKSNADPIASMSGGTYSFGAPELLPGRRGSGEANQTIDVWALGCVFSVAATWAVLGYQGVRQYSELRTDAIAKRIDKQLSQAALNPQTPELEHGDYFHDGLNVLPEVRCWHQYLRSSMRIADRITSQVLELVDEDMLVGSPTLRIKSSAVCQKLAKIRQSVQKPEQRVPEMILKFLKVLDEKILETPLKTASVEIVATKAPSHSTFKERQDRKSKYLGAPLIQTAHRSYRSSMLAPEHAEKPRQPSLGTIEEIQAPGLNTINESPPAIDLPQSNLMTEPEENHTPHATSPPPLQGLKHTSTGLTNRSDSHQAENLFQQRMALDNKRKKKSLFQSFFKSTKKDELLTKYYMHRDIKFLVDNAESMQEYWPQAKYLLETLLMKVEGIDEDGVDLIFTQGSVSATNTKGITKVMTKMDEPEATPMAGVYTDMIASLQNILDDYTLEAQRKGRYMQRLKKMTIVILTDGIWGNTPDKDGVGRSIVGFVKKLEGIIGRRLTDRSVSFEFIQFGKDLSTTSRFAYLDDKLSDDNDIPDLVDTEPWDGNIIKMLLGSFVASYDEIPDHDGSSSIGSSSTHQNSYSASRRSTHHQASMSQSSSPTGPEPFTSPQYSLGSSPPG